MKARKIAGLALACAVALGVAQPASAGLKIDLVYIDKPPPFYVAGGGELREIMQVAAENWERALKTGNGNWKLKIEFGWDALRDPTFFAQEHLVGEGGNPSRMTHSCIIFNTALGFPKDIAGFFADPTPRDNSEFLDYTSYSISTDAGWLNAGRIFSEPTGDAINRIDLLQLAMHEIGHALGLDYDYSGFNVQLPGTTGPLKVTPLRPYAGIDIFVNQGPHISGKSLMSPNAEPGERRLISAIDALLIAQLSLFNRPDLSEPPLDTNGHGLSIPTVTVASSSTCSGNVPATNSGPW